MSFTVELEPIGTQRRIRTDLWTKGFRDYIKYEGREAFKYYEQFTKAFVRHKVVLTQRSTAEKDGGVETIVGAIENTRANRVFSYVNYGTGRRIIRARNVPELKFKANYKRATIPNSWITQAPWQKTGSELRFKSVVHTGIHARNFNKLVQKAMKGEMSYEIRRRLPALAKQTWRA